ncbi:hypothetical protein [Pyxidicoccus xibeiensis]|uniref:hypothetical protein n=1 Tax=Pyxidicoccus xibeiensis TaxID=2906759 RepID=UPI0020A77171|nr:hypothetical protein [Pyxidicoccus xibeiensis]MCP3138079.1 hypothetical protein [Pyxidicoccus xibeiensis]
MPEDAGRPPVQMLLRDTTLLDVDVQQRFLAGAAFDGGTVVQDLSTGETWPVAPRAEFGDFTREGSVLLLRGRATADVRTLWLWQPGQAQAHEVGQDWSSAVVYEGTRRYVAFTEKTPDSALAVRMVPLETCTAEACPVRTLFRIELGAAYPTVSIKAGERFLWLTKRERVWLVDLESGEVKPMEHAADLTRFSPSRTRFAELTLGQNLRVRDTATGDLLWEVTPEASKLGYTFFFFDEDSVIINVNQTEEFGAYPEDRKSFQCSAQGCVQVAAAQCELEPGGPPRLLKCRRRNSPTTAFAHEVTLMSTPGVVLSQRADVFSNSHVSADARTVVWLTGKPLEPGYKLEWEGLQPSQPLLLPEPYFVHTGFFVEDPQRFVFIFVRKTSAGEENVLATWDGQTVQELSLVGGSVLLGKVRTRPNALYMNGFVPGEDAASGPSDILRFSL